MFFFSFPFYIYIKHFINIYCSFDYFFPYHSRPNGPTGNLDEGRTDTALCLAPLLIICNALSIFLEEIMEE